MLAGRQHGVVGRAQLLAAGVGAGAIEHRVASRQAPPSLPRGVRRGPPGALTARRAGWPRRSRPAGPQPPIRRGALGHPTLERPDRDHHATDPHAPAPDSSFTEPFSHPTRSPPATGSPSPPQPAPSSTSPASSPPPTPTRDERSRDPPPARTPATSSTATRPSEADRQRSDSQRPAPEATSRPTSSPSSMTAVSRRPRPTPSSRAYEVDAVWPDRKLIVELDSYDLPRHPPRLRERPPQGPPPHGPRLDRRSESRRDDLDEPDRLDAELSALGL